MTTQAEAFSKALTQDNNAASNRKQPLPESGTDKTKKSKGAFRTISEVADELDVQQHVLRFWETKFSQVRPLKRGGGRRYYRPEDVELLKRIHQLLYTEGYTIKGVQKLFRQNGKNSVLEGEVGGPSIVASMPAETQQMSQNEPAAVTLSQVTTSEPAIIKGLNKEQKNTLQSMLSELKYLRTLINDAN